MNPHRPMTAEIPGTLRAVVVGCIIGSVTVFVAVAGVLYLDQHDAGLALGLGAMSAFWGGLGFGAMLGGTVHLVRHEDDHDRSAPVGRTERPSSVIGVIAVPAADSDRAADASRVA